MWKQRSKAKPPKFLLDALNVLTANPTRYTVQIAEVFRRLVYDARMIGIYDNLPNPKRYKPEPLRMNTALQYNGTPHEKAIIGLLLTAAHLAVEPPRILSKRELADDPILALAELREHGIRRDSAVVMTRAGHKNADITAYLRKITTETHAVFDSPLYLTVATIANVALNRDDITEATVRGAIKDR